MKSIRHKPTWWKPEISEVPRGWSGYNGQCISSDTHWHYNCNGTELLDSMWKTIVLSPQWEAWERDVAKRFSRGVKKGSKKIYNVWDVDECRALGIISGLHFQSFLDFVIKRNRKRK